MRRVLLLILPLVLATGPAGAHPQQPRLARFVGMRAAAANVWLVDQEGRSHGRFAFYVQADGAFVVNDEPGAAPVAETLWSNKPSGDPASDSSPAVVDFDPVQGGTATFTHMGLPVSLRFTPYGDPLVMRGDGFGVWTSWSEASTRHSRTMCVGGTVIRGMLVEGTVGDLLVIGPPEVPFTRSPGGLIGSLRAETHSDIDTRCVVSSRIPAPPLAG